MIGKKGTVRCEKTDMVRVRKRGEVKEKRDTGGKMVRVKG